MQGLHQGCPDFYFRAVQRCKYIIDTVGGKSRAVTNSMRDMAFLLEEIR